MKENSRSYSVQVFRCLQQVLQGQSLWEHRRIQQVLAVSVWFCSCLHRAQLKPSSWAGGTSVTVYLQKKKKKGKDAGEEVWSEVKSVRNSSVTIRVRAAEEQRFSHRLWRAHATEGAPGRNGSSGRAVLEQEKRVRRRRETVTQWLLNTAYLPWGGGGMLRRWEWRR